MEKSLSKRNAKRMIWIIIALAFMFFFGYLPAPEGLSQLGMRVLGIFIGCLILWITVATDWSSILCLVMLAFIPEVGYQTALKESFGNWIFIFLVCVFAITYTLSKTPFIKRCALFFITCRIAKRGPWWFLTLFWASAMLLCMIMSPTALFVTFLPIASEIFKEIKIEHGNKIGTIVTLGLVFVCSLGSLATPIAHTFILLPISNFFRETGFMIDYTAYMAFGITVSIIVFAIMILLFKFVEKPDLTPIKQFDAEKLKAELPPVGRDEKIIVTVFLAVIVFWVLPGILKFFWPAGADFISSLGTCTPPMIGLVLLCIITNEGKPIMDIGDALKNGVPWGSIIMAVVVIAIGAALTLPEAGVTSWLTSLLSPLVQGLAPWLVILLFIAWAIIQTNVSSNMVTITVVYTVAIPLALASGGTINAAGNGMHYWGGELICFSNAGCNCSYSDCLRIAMDEGFRVGEIRNNACDCQYHRAVLRWLPNPVCAIACY